MPIDHFGTLADLLGFYYSLICSSLPLCILTEGLVSQRHQSQQLLLLSLASYTNHAASNEIIHYHHPVTPSSRILLFQ